MGPDEIISAERVLLIAAHPDDEVIAAGAQFEALGPRLTIVHVTDGSPRNPADALAAGFYVREEYGAARRQESYDAAALAGITPGQFRSTGITDQESTFALGLLTGQLASIIEELQPDVVLTHPYEGGHPDHDATAFAVHAAIRLTSHRPSLWEFASYHAGPDGNVQTGQFLPHGGAGTTVVWGLSKSEQALKVRMFACFVTQQHILGWFGTRNESFRLAPGYDFTSPPHPGPLFYESFEWGMDGAQFRRLAGAALEALGLSVKHAVHNS